MMYFARADNFRAVIRFCNRVGGTTAMKVSGYLRSFFIPPLFALFWNAYANVQKKKRMQRK